MSNVMTTRYLLDASGYASGAKRVVDSTKQTGQAIDMMSARAATGQKMLDGMGGAFDGFHRRLTTFAAAVVGAGVGIGVMMSRAGAEMEALEKGLAAVAGSEAAAREQLKRLKDVAKTPGLGFKEAIQGSLQLQAVGFAALDAERSLTAFGNAIALVGGGKDELNGVTLQLMQMVAKGKVVANEINAISQRVPQLRQAMIAAFGTADTEALQKMGVEAKVFVERIVKELERLPKAGGGMKNEIENMDDAMFRFAASGGKALNQFLAPAIGKVAGTIERMTESGQIERAVQGFTRLFRSESLGDAMVNILERGVRAVEELPRHLETAKTVAKGLAVTWALLFGAKVVSNVWSIARGIQSIAVGLGLVKAAGAGAAIAGGAGAAAGTAAAAGGAGLMAGLLPMLLSPMVIGATVVAVTAYMAHRASKGISELERRAEERAAQPSAAGREWLRRREEKIAQAQAVQAAIDASAAKGEEDRFTAQHGMTRQQAEHRRAWAAYYEETERDRIEAAKGAQQKYEAAANVVGGGDMARRGVAAVELTRRRSRNSKQQKVLAAIADLLSDQESVDLLRARRMGLLT